MLFKLLTIAVYAPIAAWFFKTILRTSGNPAVSNFDLVSFFLSAPGLALVVTFVVASFVLLFFELGGLIRAPVFFTCPLPPRGAPFD